MHEEKIRKQYNEVDSMWGSKMSEMGALNL